MNLNPPFAVLDWYLNDQYRDALTHLGPLPQWINRDSVLSAQEQIAAHREWIPAPPDSGFSLTADDYLIYDGLPPLAPAAHAWHLGQKILVYPHGFVVVVEIGGRFSCARIGA